MGILENQTRRDLIIQFTSARFHFLSKADFGINTEEKPKLYVHRKNKRISSGKGILGRLRLTAGSI